MWERVIRAIIVSLIMTGVPALYNLSKKNKINKEAQGKVYYGVFRMILLYIASIETYRHQTYDILHCQEL